MSSESAIAATLEFNAACQWVAYWLDATATGDTKAQADAQTTLDEIPNWPALLATDLTGGGDDGIMQMWRNIAEAARAGDEQGVRDNGYTLNCTDVPVTTGD